MSTGYGSYPDCYVCNRCGQLMPAVIFIYHDMSLGIRTEDLVDPLFCPRCLVPLGNHSVRHYRRDPGPHALIADDLQAAMLLSGFALNQRNHAELRAIALEALKFLLEGAPSQQFPGEPKWGIVFETLRAIVREGSDHYLVGMVPPDKTGEYRQYDGFVAAVSKAKCLLQRHDAASTSETASPGSFQADATQDGALPDDDDDDIPPANPEPSERRVAAVEG